MIKQIKNNLDKVYSLLTNQPELRENDNRLTAVFWAYELGLDNLHKMTASELLAKLSKGQLTASDTITRARRKVQEENEGLRGSNYKGRQEKEQEVRKNINK
jgi:hypothetical protein